MELSQPPQEGGKEKGGKKPMTPLFIICVIIGLLISLDGFRAPERQIVSRGVVRVIEGYQHYISRGILSRHNINICRYTPTCSEYTRQSLLKYGLYRGGARGFYRILRCNPWSRGGVDEP
jgi:uncharacterized protein